MKFSVIIAAHNESSQIRPCLRRLRQISQTSPMEVILVDGNSTDDTVAVSREWVDKVIVSEEANRGAQLHEGALAATGDLFFFLRPDSQPPGNWQQSLERFWLASHPDKVAASVFTVDYGGSRSFRFASYLSNASARLRGLAGGDHGICTTAEIYKECGGYPRFQFREDFEFCERLKKVGRIVLLEDRIWPAARRMHRIGVGRCLFDHFWYELRFKFGAAPESLWKAYSSR